VFAGRNSKSNKTAIRRPRGAPAVPRKEVRGPQCDPSCRKPKRSEYPKAFDSNTNLFRREKTAVANEAFLGSEKDRRSLRGVYRLSGQSKKAIFEGQYVIRKLIPFGK